MTVVKERFVVKRTSKWDGTTDRKSKIADADMLFRLVALFCVDTAEDRVL